LKAKGTRIGVRDLSGASYPRDLQSQIKETKLMPAEALKEPPALEDALREVSNIRSIVTDAVEDGVRSASQAIRHGRYAAEDVIEEAKHTVKQRPLQVMGVVFAAGVLAGCFLTWIGFRRR
jgi:ElaB/YqjD/DUF883 family membrane-anchored ribosome-binding protein